MIPEPFPQLLVVDLLAVHQYACAVDAPCKPRGSHKTDNEHHHAEGQFPIGYSERDAYHHDDGRCEWDDAEPEGHWPFGIGDHVLRHDEGEDDGRGDGHHELLRIGLVVHCRAYGREQRAVEQIST
jgi:hypothetical protein